MVIPTISPFTWLKIGLSVVVLAVALWAAGTYHEHVQQTGRDEIQALWDKDKKAHEEAIAKLKADYETKEEAHRTENRRISHALSQANIDHANALAAVELEFAKRLRSSEQRAAIYKRQAQGGTSERGDLANHASRLDASLEEGRSLVRELRETLGLRDRQVSSLSEQILNDRKLFTEESGK